MSFAFDFICKRELCAGWESGAGSICLLAIRCKKSSYRNSFKWFLIPDTVSSPEHHPELLTSEVLTSFKNTYSNFEQYTARVSKQAFNTYVTGRFGNGVTSDFVLASQDRIDAMRYEAAFELLSWQQQSIRSFQDKVVEKHLNKADNQDKNIMTLVSECDSIAQEIDVKVIRRFSMLINRLRELERSLGLIKLGKFESGSKDDNRSASRDTKCDDLLSFDDVHHNSFSLCRSGSISDDNSSTYRSASTALAQVDNIADNQSICSASASNLEPFDNKSKSIIDADCSMNMSTVLLNSSQASNDSFNSWEKLG